MVTQKILLERYLVPGETFRVIAEEGKVEGILFAIRIGFFHFGFFLDAVGQNRFFRELSRVFVIVIVYGQLFPMKVAHVLANNL